MRESTGIASLANHLGALMRCTIETCATSRAGAHPHTSGRALHWLAAAANQTGTFVQSGVRGVERRRETCNVRRASVLCRSTALQERLRSVQEVCKELDDLLADCDCPARESQAVELVNQSASKGVLRAFGCGTQVPKRLYTIEELRLNKIDPEKLLSPKDESVNAIRNQLQASAVAGLAALAYFSDFDMATILLVTFGTTFLLILDQIGVGGGGEALIVDTLGRRLNPTYGQRVAYHEAGHFLVAYLLGLLPKAYTLSALDAFLKYRTLNLQGGTRFCDGAFMQEVASGSLKSSSLDQFTCVALAGVVTEYLRFGQAEGGVGDVAMLDQLFRRLQFTQKKADGEVRWAVLNVAAILRQHSGLHDKLAAAMAAGRTVGECVSLIEEGLLYSVEEDSTR